jgi:hypothetical protein
MDSLSESLSALGPYRGRREELYKLRVLFALVIFCVGLLLPWLEAITFRHSSTRTHALAITGNLALVNLVSLDILGICGFFSAYLLIASLSKRIEIGGPDADWLDGVRDQIAGISMTGALLFFLALVPSLVAR